MPTLLDAIPNLHIRFVLHGSGEVVGLARELAVCSLVVQELLTDVELLAAEDEVVLTIPACPQVPVGAEELALANRVVRAFCQLFPAEVAAQWENVEWWAEKMRTHEHALLPLAGALPLVALVRAANWARYMHTPLLDAFVVHVLQTRFPDFPLSQLATF
ncbi:hypothetical protein M3Y99_01989300 [Aphelenchoides fujianensis]|nr:hypothetical protein M3Y99_01989300 [Aphelenchoides fujianensis]